jgi:hypothetical protein
MHESSSAETGDWPGERRLVHSAGRDRRQRLRCYMPPLPGGLPYRMDRSIHLQLFFFERNSIIAHITRTLSYILFLETELRTTAVFSSPEKVKNVL